MTSVRHKRAMMGVLGAALLLASADAARGQPASDGAVSLSRPVDNALGLPDLRRLAPAASDRAGVTSSLAILVVLTVLSLAPAILVLATSFTRTVVVLSLLRQALGLQQLPPSQVMVGLSLIMTFLVMAPTWREMQRDAVTPYLEGKMAQSDALARGAAPLRRFMIRQIESGGNEDHVRMFAEFNRGAAAARDLKWSDVSMVELLPAFVLSELKIAFVMGFRVYLPFLVIDMVISAILISMGMMMLPPVLVSLPFKLMLFVLADGWRLVAGSILTSFG